MENRKGKGGVLLKRSYSHCLADDGHGSDGLVERWHLKSTEKRGFAEARRQGACKWQMQG